MCVKGEGGERSISHTQKGIQGGNVRGDDVSEWAWVMEKAFREKRKKKKEKKPTTTSKEEDREFNCIFNCWAETW